MPRHAITFLLRLRYEYRCEEFADEFQQLMVLAHWIVARCRGHGRLHVLATIVEHDQLGGGRLAQVDGIHLVLRDEDIVIARGDPLLPVRFRHESQITRHGTKVCLPVPGERLLIVDADVEMQPGLGHETQVGLMKIKRQNPG